jgi:peptidyl-prolyl cis-trans isomerase B (cyclophilin B)
MNKSILILFIFIIILSGCAQDKKDYIVTIKTNYGDMVAILYDETPLHKKNFIKLAQEHYYDSLLFHRVVQGFMIQGGDSNSKKAQPGVQLGTGEIGYTIPAEFNSRLFHERGALCAARQSDEVNPTKASSGNQFYVVQGKVVKPEEMKLMQFDQRKLGQGLQQYIQNPAHQATMDSLNQLYASQNMAGFENKVYSLVPLIEKETGLKIKKEVSEEKTKVYTTVGGTPFLDGDYTVFGKVIQGLDVVDKIAALQVDPMSRPQEDVRMFVSVKEMSRKKIEKEYGFKYPDLAVSKK